MSEIKILLKEKRKMIELGKCKEVAEICNALGNELVLQERYEEALEQHQEELEFCDMTRDQMSIAVANRKLGECFTHMCNFKKAVEHIRKYFDISERLNSDLEKQRAWATFGRTYYLKYQYEIASGIIDPECKSLDLAELAYCKALKLLPKLVSEIKTVEFAEMKCRLLLNLGLVSENRQKNELSCSHIKEALEISLKHNLFEDIQRCAFALGSIHQKIGNVIEANKAYETALTAAKKLRNKNMMCEILLSKSIILLCQEKIDDAKKCLKQAYKLRTTNNEDQEKISKTLKACIGVHNCDKQLKICSNYPERKMLLEKIADGLSSVGCFKLAIKKYFLTLDCMEQANANLSEKAPIYFSLARTYLDDENILKALEYFEKEFNCNEGKPVEQIKTLWEIAEVLEKQRNADKIEEIYLKAISIAEKAQNNKILHTSLCKLISFYESIEKTENVTRVKNKLNTIKYECQSDDEYDAEDTQDIFSDINLSELSDSDNDEEKIRTNRRLTKRVEGKVNDKGETPLHQACINGNLNLVKKLVESGHSVNVRDFCGWTPLHEASNFGFYDIVEYLLDKRANINDPGGPGCRGITALHDAASCGNLDVMQLLIARGASVIAVDKNGETPLHALSEWKRRLISENDMDDVTLKQCEIIEKELKSKLREAGMSVDDNDIFSHNNMPNEFDNDNNYKDKAREKRARSPSTSSDADSYSDDIIDDTPHMNKNQNWNDAENAKYEYKSVMENLRRSAAAISPVKSCPPKEEIDCPPLVNENEIVNDWLIKDTNEIPKAKRKKRRLARLNVRTSKCINNYLIPKEISETKEANSILSDEENNDVIGSVNKNIGRNSTQATVNESSKISFCLRVHIADKLILIPVPDDNSTISWLSEEAANRYKNLDGSRPHLTLMKNEALLSGSDLVKNIFSNNEEVMSSVESWDEPALEDRYVQLCTKRNTEVSSLIKKKFQCFESAAELNFSNCSILSQHFSIIFTTILNFKRLQHLNISGTVISDLNMKELIACVPCFSNLVTLNLSCCCLTSESFRKFTDYLQKNADQNLLPSLKSLDLSFNNLFLNCFLPLFNLRSLVSLNLSSCGLNSSLFSNQSFCCMLRSKHSMENFDVSGNILEENGISRLLKYLPKLSLKKISLKHTLKEEIQLGSKLFDFFSDYLLFLKELDFQGCYLTDIDINQVSLCLRYCPQLQSLDVSANPSLSSYSLCNFMNAAYENNLNISNINVTGTCVWQDEQFSDLSKWLRFKTLNNLCLDNCSESLIEVLFGSWKSKWGNRAICSNYGFCQLSIV